MSEGEEGLMAGQSWSIGKKIMTGAVVLAGAPLVVACAISGARQEPQGGPAAASSHGATKPATTSPASALSPAVTAAAGRVHPAADLDQDGDEGTPCAVTYAPTADGAGTLLLVTLTRSGEFIGHIDGPDGLVRHDQKSEAGQLRFTDAVPLSKVSGAGAVLQDADGTRHVCAIRPAG